MLLRRTRFSATLSAEAGNLTSFVLLCLLFSLGTSLIFYLTFLPEHLSCEFVVVVVVVVVVSRVRKTAKSDC
jgi:hypothetical protein